MLTALLVNIMVVPTMAADTVPAETELGLSLDQAVDMALKHSNDLKIAKLNIDRSWEVRQNASDAQKNTYVPDGPNAGAASTAFTSLVSSDLAWRMSKKTAGLEEDKIVLSVFDAYVKVLNALDNLKNSENTLAYSQWQLNVTRASYENGVASQSQMSLMQNQNNGYKAANIIAQQDVVNAYQALNRLIGADPEYRPVLSDKPDYSIIQVDNVEAAAQRAVEESPAIWLAEQNINIAELQLKLYNSGGSEPWGAKTIDVDKAKITAANAKEQFKQAVRTLYNNIIDLEQSYNGKVEALKAAEEELRVTKVKFDAGMATRGEVLNAELNVSTKQNDLNSTVNQHEYLKMAFNKPWAL
jgi:outer membrane protein